MALFTIEQIELIRRLKSSGITKEQVLQAFNELDRLDAEFSRNMPYNDPLRNHNGLEFPYDSMSPEAPSNNGSGITNGNISNLSGAVNGMPESCLSVPYKQNEIFSSHSLSRAHCSSTNSSESIPESEIHNGDFPSHTSELSSKLQNDLNAISAADSTSSVTMTDSMSQPLFSNSVSSFFPFESQPEELAELQELKKKGDMAVLAEIRNFVMTYNIKQTLIAEMTKMSQPYVSRFFRGDIQDMPDRTKNIFYMWYLTCKNNPLKLEWPLSERDIVTLPVVNNWFNNRRKDAKKQMRLKHGSPPSVGVQSCQASPLSSMHPATVWSPCVVSSPPSYPVYPDRNDITESDSSSASDRLMESENLVIDLQEQEPCDVKQIL